MAEVGIDGDRVQAGERLLWLAVLGENLTLVLRGRDISSLGSGERDIHEARQWIGSDGFREVCHLAGVQPAWVLRVVREQMALPVAQRHVERAGIRNISSHKDFIRRVDLPARARGRYAV